MNHNTTVVTAGVDHDYSKDNSDTFYRQVETLEKRSSDYQGKTSLRSRQGVDMTSINQLTVMTSESKSNAMSKSRSRSQTPREKAAVSKSSKLDVEYAEE